MIFSPKKKKKGIAAALTLLWQEKSNVQKPEMETGVFILSRSLNVK